jgi:hypothetical protein
MNHYFFADREAKYRREQHLRRAEQRRLLHLVTQEKPPWLYRPSCWFLRLLGRRLVLLGQSLEQVGQSHSDMLNGRSKSGALSGNGEIIL